METEKVKKEGLELPLKWMANKCKKTIPNITNGKKKWRLKKNFKVKLLTANPLQIIWVILTPKKGITLKNLVITVAAQNDICPHGRT